MTWKRLNHCYSCEAMNVRSTLAQCCQECCLILTEVIDVRVSEFNLLLILLKYYQVFSSPVHQRECEVSSKVKIDKYREFPCQCNEAVKRLDGLLILSKYFSFRKEFLSHINSWLSNSQMDSWHLMNANIIIQIGLFLSAQKWN